MLKKTSKLLKASVALSYLTPLEIPEKKKKTYQTTLRFPGTAAQLTEPDSEAEDFLPSLSYALDYYNSVTGRS